MSGNNLRNRLKIQEVDKIFFSFPCLPSWYRNQDVFFMNNVCKKVIDQMKELWDDISHVILLPLQPWNRPKINLVRIRRRQFSLTYSVMGWKKVCVCVCVCVYVCLPLAVSRQLLDYASQKIFGPICHFGPFWAIFPIFTFFF